ncbi:Protein TIC 20-II, chloroplastic [Stylosanthes scabra]|uniref:Protein TIC 20 n=1 Tax=Stylosanthes scabra TaxID=79078 RepID=A0ABU6YHM8_9FABA|nr:Protein TIC 20-II, chloroplastic [Stylosanthes scabra]
MASIPLLFRSTFLKPPPITLTQTHHRQFSSLPNHKTKRIPQNGTVSTRTSTTTKCSYTSPPPTERLISIAAYTLPFFNSLQYGRFILSANPNLAVLFDPLIPLLSLYRSLPYASFIAFFALYLGIVRNTSLSRYVRFNAMQAVTLDVLLVVPLLIQRILAPGRTGLGFQVMVWSHNALFVFSVVCFVYSVVTCVVGRTPTLPFVADAASRQL